MAQKIIPQGKVVKTKPVRTCHDATPELHDGKPIAHSTFDDVVLVDRETGKIIKDVIVADVEKGVYKRWKNKKAKLTEWVIEADIEWRTKT